MEGVARLREVLRRGGGAARLGHATVRRYRYLAHLHVAMVDSRIAQALHAANRPRGARAMALHAVNRPCGARAMALHAVNRPRGARAMALHAVNRPRGARAMMIVRMTKP